MGRTGDAVYHRKDGLWEARYVKEIDAYGKKKYGSVYGHSKREAREKRQDALDRILLCQKAVPTRRITVMQLAQEWLFINQNRIKLSTYQRYQGFLKNHIEPVIGNLSVVYLTTATIHEFSLNRLETGLSPQTVNSILIFLHACLKYGHKQYQLPLPEFIYLSYEKKEMRVLSQEEQQRLVNYLLKDTDIYKFGVLIALYTGIRLGELCALKWEDVGSDSIKIKHTMQRLSKNNGEGTDLFIGAPKTTTSMRIIPIPSFLKDMIEEFRRKGEGQIYLLGSKDKKVVEPRLMQYRFKRHLLEAQIEKANFHALRHSFATRAIEVGFEVKSLSEILGHATVQITLDKYVHSSFELKQDNMDLLKAAW